MRMQSLLFLCPIFLSTAAHAIHTSDYPTFKISRAEIIGVSCEPKASHITVAENSGHVVYAVPDDLCAVFKAKYGNALKCTSVRGDLQVEDQTWAWGLLGEMVIVHISHDEARAGACI